MLLNCCRQSGKSTTTAVLAVHTALYESGALVLLLSPSLRQSGELFKKAAEVYAAAGKPVSADSATALTLTLANGSRIVSLPGGEQRIRGYSGVRLLLIDEAARVLDDTYLSVRPMLAVSGGRLIAMSSPWGQRGFFYTEWTQGSSWERVEIPAAQCPRIPAAFLAEEKRTMPPRWYAQEYGCSFEQTEDAVFDAGDINRAMDPTLRPLWDVPTLSSALDDTLAPLAS